MEHISVMFWTELSRYIGTEEQVFIRRQIFKCTQKVMEHVVEILLENIVKPITSGSTAEGLLLPGSDIDYMFVISGKSVSDNPDTLDCDIQMDTNNIKPGFARLVCSDNLRNHEIFTNAITETDEGMFLSSLLFRDQIVDAVKEYIPDAIAHGPCTTYKSPLKIEIDNLHCLSCNTWPQTANEWVVRVRNNYWPSPDLISDIVRDGCLLVPIGNPNSQESYMQWRISFSLAEKKLVHSFNHTQFLCYGLLKLYLKHVINSNAEVENLLCSYFLKTSIFFCIEEENIVWNKENFLNCFWTCVRRLIKWVRDEYCPNFFIKANNMFEGKICGNKRRVLLEHLSKLYNDGEDSMRHIPCLSDLHNSVVEIKMTTQEKEYISDMELFNLISAYVDPLFNNLFNRIFNVSMHDYIKELQQSNNGIQKTIITFMTFKMAYSLVQSFFNDIHTHRSNKIRFKQIRSLKKFIRQNCMLGDVCNGKLLLATLCYLIGDLKEAVDIAQKVSTEFKSYTIYFGTNEPICNSEEYMNEICGKGLTMTQKLARGVMAQSFVCVLEYKFYPLEIEHELAQYSEFNRVFIPPVVYSNVLLFLSYHHMACKEKMSYILNELYVAVNNDQFVHENERPLANALLQRCLQIWETWQLH